MNVRELIELLKAENPDARVVCFDGPDNDILDHSGPQRITLTRATPGGDMYFLAKPSDPEAFEAISL